MLPLPRNFTESNAFRAVARQFDYSDTADFALDLQGSYICAENDVYDARGVCMSFVDNEGMSPSWTNWDRGFPYRLTGVSYVGIETYDAWQNRPGSFPVDVICQREITPPATSSNVIVTTPSTIVASSTQSSPACSLE